eukprot:jgi/Tetstr1/425010/TSEL_015478.t1
MPAVTTLAASAYLFALAFSVKLVVASDSRSGPSDEPPIWQQVKTLADEARLTERMREEWHVPVPDGLAHEKPFGDCGSKLKVPTHPHTYLEKLGDFFDHHETVDERSTDRYDLIRKLGRGAQGLVALARDKHTHELVAIKKAKAGTVARETALLQALQMSDDIMVIKDVLRPRNPANGHDQHGFVVYERLVLPIDEMFALWGGYSKTPKAALKHVLFNIVRGLNFMHAHGVVHGDVKMDNIMISEGCGPRIVDLGQARYLYTSDGEVRSIRRKDISHGMHAIEYHLSDKTENDLRWEGDEAVMMAKAADVWNLGHVLLTILHGGWDPMHQFAVAMGHQDTHYEDDMVIFSHMLGRPSDNVLNKYYSKAGKALLQEKHSTEDTPLEKVFHHIDQKAIAMVRRIMKMDPSERPSTKDILLDPYFKDVRSSPSHKPSLAEELQTDQNILDFFKAKGLTGGGTFHGVDTLFELSLAYAPTPRKGELRRLLREI